MTKNLHQNYKKETATATAKKVLVTAKETKYLQDGILTSSPNFKYLTKASNSLQITVNLCTRSTKICTKWYKNLQIFDKTRRLGFSDVLIVSDGWAW